MDFEDGKMPKPLALIEYDKCKPEKCSPNDGICCAVKVCTRSILKQEDIYESPMVFPADMCQGCSDCVKACSLGAIIIVNT